MLLVFDIEVFYVAKRAGTSVMCSWISELVFPQLESVVVILRCTYDQSVKQVFPIQVQCIRNREHSDIRKFSKKPEI